MIRCFLCLLLLASILAPTSAYAYIDPMSGSILLQALVAGFLAGLLVMKRFWYRVTETLRRIWQQIVS